MPAVASLSPLLPGPPARPNDETVPDSGPAIDTMSTQILTPADLRAVMPEMEASGGALAAPAPPGGNGAVFFQDYEADAPGTQPAGWEGQYDYATLAVDERVAPSGAGHSLRFEKRSGAGSANYTCRFPNASGRIVVEFDIRCDDKNKYLLGFYVEKDEDFKQSVHTIIHRMDSKSQPSLRIHGEPIPYDFGTWRHVRYEIDLPKGRLDASVDGETVVTDVKLASSPDYVNTLSIRDNLATTGLLYLDNVRIAKA